MFGAFFDESSDGASAVVYVTAGWLASDEAWQGFNDRWSDVLLEFEIDEFKARNCEAGEDAFRGWSLSKRDDLRRQLLAVIGDSKLAGIATAINLAEASPMITEPIHYQPYMYCIQDSIVATYGNTPEGEKACIVFDRKVGINGRVPSLVEAMRRADLIEISNKVAARPPIERDSIECFGVQAADLLAYEIKRHAEALIKNPQGDFTYSRWIFESLEPQIVSSRYLNGEDAGILIADRLFLGWRPQTS